MEGTSKGETHVELTEIRRASWVSRVRAAKIRRAGGQIEWIARYRGNDAKCADTEGTFIYMGSCCAFDGDERERESEKRGWAHRWPLESGHAVMGRKRPLLAMPPRSSLAQPPSRAATEVEGLPRCRLGARTLIPGIRSSLRDRVASCVDDATRRRCSRRLAKILLLFRERSTSV